MSKRFYDDYEKDAIEIWDELREIRKICATLQRRIIILESENK